MKNKGAGKRYAVKFTGVFANESPRRKRSGYLNGTYFSFATSGGEFTHRDPIEIKVLGNPDVAPTKIQYIKESILSLSHKHLY